MAWTVTFPAELGDVPPLEPDPTSLAGTGAAVRVSTVADGLAGVGGSLSLVASGVEGEVRRSADGGSANVTPAAAESLDRAASDPPATELRRRPGLGRPSRVTVASIPLTHARVLREWRPER